MATYMIGDLMTLTGLSRHTINYYLNVGLIEPAGQSPRNRYRYFNDDTVDRLRRIIELRQQKIPIRRIKRQLAEE